MLGRRTQPLPANHYSPAQDPFLILTVIILSQSHSHLHILTPIYTFFIPNPSHSYPISTPHTCKHSTPLPPNILLSYHPHPTQPSTPLPHQPPTLFHTSISSSPLYPRPLPLKILFHHSLFHSESWPHYHGKFLSFLNV